ncbi:winged helix-turn-helix domain-containing protein [Marinilongibacter aquaticus]|uniref:winged helix-turn-helix domain-containing protein n=1 Tax=Marinilongibacter aquaticus TaxID=2975157 RepID=UPI0021BD2425|nr:winged helix-turn-helix domain-containing protein [Marinilongibacter aquaticus]UBM60186.1 winged helix-turn-helix domain-containing protein [Marinilongibacter aquaticus]
MISRLSFLLCLIFLGTLRAQDESHIKVSLRMIGHQILLHAGDSTSRVLPIEQNDHFYRIKFESEFSFKPDELVSIIDSIMVQANLGKDYIVEVESCESQSIVYSYEIGNAIKSDIVPCTGRSQPKACYMLSIRFPERENTFLPLAKSGIAAFLIFSSGLFVFYQIRQRKKQKDKPDQIQIGQFVFDKIHMQLVHSNTQIELSGKEAELLALLIESKNETIDRETILKEVWGDEGDYIGRTLDVFISKLRKKLEADPEVKIVNIRGVGYKLLCKP